MATPAFLRYLPARLKPLRSPAVWAPLTVFALLGIFLLEYSKNPDWFDGKKITEQDPDSELTAEERAKLSEIDTLDVLLGGTRVSEDSPEATSLIDPDDPQSELESESDPAAGIEEAATSAASRQLSGRDDPFGAYAEEYKFGGSSQTNSAPAISSRNSSGQNAAGRVDVGSFNFGDGLVNSAAPATNSALSEALSRQQTARDAAAGGGSSSAASSTQPSPEAARAGEAGVRPAQVPGNISAPYIPTTPDMSPPVGTTGYQTPATSSLPVFNTPAQQPTRNPYSAPTLATPSTQPAQLPNIPAQSETLYTAPTFTQPEQNRRVR
ncbi:MAG: hypothetical protein WA885_25355 [Phormidesmis sp.]